MLSRHPSRKPSPVSRFVRRTIESIALLAIAAMVTETFLVDGWISPEVVSSGSMAPALLGPHRVGRCAACGCPIVCDADGLTGDVAVCLNCGWPGNQLEPGVVEGDRLFIDLAAVGCRAARRWEVVVFRSPGNAREYSVKRIVSLPGETVEVRDGDVYIDGIIARKTLAQQRAMAIAVSDSAWRDPKVPARWQSEPQGNWRASESGYQRTETAKDVPKPAGADSPIDWLTYTHWQRKFGAPDLVEESPIRDDDAYNPSTSRRLNDVSDLMLVARLTARGSGDLFLKAADGRETFQLKLHPETGQLTLSRDGRQVAATQASLPLADRPLELVFSTFDRQILLAIDGQAVLTYPYEPSTGPPKPTSRPLAIGARDLNVEIDRLQLFRDVYYTSPTRPNVVTSWQLGPDEYFVLGDNSPISVDSRAWTGGKTVPGSLLIGRPLPPRARGDR